MVMTLEEAGEIVLSGKGWMPCRECGGTGKGELREVTAHGLKNYKEAAIRFSIPDICINCQGKGQCISRHYREAARRVGVKENPPPVPVKYYSNVDDAIEACSLDLITQIEMYNSRTNQLETCTFSQPIRKR